MRIDVKYSDIPQRALSIWEKYQVAEILSQYPALTLKVLFRRRVGLRRADPLPVLFMASLLFCVGWMFKGIQTHFGWAVLMFFGMNGLMLFAVAVAVNSIRPF